MKKLTLAVAAVCIIAVQHRLNAQNKVWSVGPEVGVNFSGYGMDADDNKYTPGIAAGVFFTYSVISTFGVTAKVLYSEKGADLGNNKQSLKYIEIPVLGRFFLNKEGRFRPNFFLGPSFGLLRGVYNKIDSADPVRLPEYEKTFNKYDMGAAVGIGLNYLISGHTRVLVDARYTHGLRDLTKAPGQINNESISITCGLSFGI